MRHEQGATHAAQGFARASGRVGVCLVTSGPGATNTITGIADAMIDSTPIVVIAGQVGTSFLGSDAFQEVDLVGVTQPISKWSYQIRRAEDVPWAVARAFYIASSGRPGPVVLDFAKNAQVETFEYQPTTVDFVRSYVPVPDTDPMSLVMAADLINKAQRPLVLVGQGVELGNAQEQLIQFIEKAEMPAGCTLLGLSALPSDHRLNVGMLGMHGNLAPNVKTNECDVLIAVGMRFDDRVTGNLATYAKQAKIIHFDIDPAEINKNVKVDVAVLGDCKDTLKAVTELMVPARHKEWLDSFAPYAEEERVKVIEPEIHPGSGLLNMGEVVRAVSEATRNEAVLVTDRALAGADTLATSYTLSCCAKKLGKFDLILCGRQAIDGDTAQVGPQIAEKLKIPQLCYVEEVRSLEPGKVVVRRAIEGGYEVLESPTPALLTVIDANDPRPMNAKRLMKFKRAKTVSEVAKLHANANYTDGAEQDEELKKLEKNGLLIREFSAKDIDADPGRIGFPGSPTKVKNVMSVVLTASEARSVPATDEGISLLIHELISDHTLG